MPRETVELKTSGGHSVVHKTWLSGREFNQIESVYLAAANMQIGEDGKPKMGTINPNIEMDASKKLIEVSVVSVDSKTESLVDTVLDLPVEEYNEVISALKKISGKKK